MVLIPTNAGTKTAALRLARERKAPVPKPGRGDVWLADLDPTRGHEQAGRRPVLVVSVDSLNESEADLAVVVPLSSRARRTGAHVAVDPPEGGLRLRSQVMPEHVRSISTDRCVERCGTVEEATMGEVEQRLRALLGL